MATSDPKKTGLVHLLRQVSQDLNRKRAEEAIATGENKILSVLDYVEQPWGLNMRLFPAQRFIVKLYYNLELDTKLPEDPNHRIQITDMYRTKVLYEFTEAEYLVPDCSTA